MFRKKIPFRRIIPPFSAKVQNLAVFSIIYMIRIRFFGPRELNQKGFSGARYTCSKHGSGASVLNFPVFGSPDQGSDARETMQIFVKTLTDKTIVVHVDASDTVDILFSTNQVKIAVPVLQTRLIVAVAGKQLEVGKTLFDYNIKKNTHIFVVGKLRGGTSQAPINIETAGGKMSFRLGSPRGTLTEERAIKRNQE